MRKPLLLFLVFISSSLYAQKVTLTVDAHSQLGKISTYIYGRNNNLSDNPASPLDAEAWRKYNDAGLKMYRDNGGNNSTKYNWRRKLSSHPDWYNNVYPHDWDFAASSLLSNTHKTQGLFALQTLGKAAKTTSHNFNDWCYNNSNWWNGVGNNWAGGGGPSCGSYVGNNGNGDPNLYLEEWTADSTVGILDHWFGTLQLDSTRLRYWNLDNEPDIWAYSHDDVTSKDLTPEQLVQKYITVAKAARKKFPGIKLVGPVTANEWFWYLWNNQLIQDPVNPSISYPWTEYFIKRIAEEQKASGIKLLDVLDCHFYPGTEGDIANTLQVHRVWYDTTYNFPKAGGVKALGNTQKEFFFLRCNRWLEKHFGPNHGVSLSLTEYGAIDSSNPNVVACSYASTLGVFAENGVEIFTPWNWYSGQWEVLHLFSNYFGNIAVKTKSSNDETVSGYSALSIDGDSLMVAIVNRHVTNSKSVSLNINNFAPSATLVNGYQLANLPSTETFVSSSTNALQKYTYQVSGNTMEITVPKLSITLIQIPTNNSVVTANEREPKLSASDLILYPNPGKNSIFLVLKELQSTSRIYIRDIVGKEYEVKKTDKKGEIDISHLSQGHYILHLVTEDRSLIKAFIKD